MIHEWVFRESELGYATWSYWECNRCGHQVYGDKSLQLDIGKELKLVNGSLVDCNEYLTMVVHDA